MHSPAEGFRDYWHGREWKGVWSAEDDRVGEFYVPLLARARSYDRMAGYFTSSALSLAAAGLSSFVAHGGIMRLIVGAQLDPADVEAIERGEPLSEAVARALLRGAEPEGEVADASSVIAEHRRAVLGWLVRDGRLEIKVGVPVDPASGRPLGPAQTTEYFHSKYGIFTDWADPAERVAFIGSDNESWQGWAGNHETFATAPTWRGETWSDIGAGLVAKFDAHWNDRPDEGWRVLELHEAVRDRLVSWARTSAPPTGLDPEARRRPDPLAAPSAPIVVDPELVDLAAAPSHHGGTFVGLSTAGVEPLPHQASLVRKAVASWPRGYFLADEVGLGKTIEAGFVIRELILSKRAARFLLLVPAAVLRQWQEELAEKLNLRVNRFEKGEFVDPDNRPVEWSGSPWAAFPIVLASSHLARRRDRLREVRAAGPWDVVLVDEAHHARRSGGKPDGRPNQLLALLRALRDDGAWRALYLSSATPMQMHPHEAWDLVELLGLPGKWADGPQHFVRYFTELREEFEQRQWNFLTVMAHASLSDPAGRTDPVLDDRIDHDLGIAEARWVRQVGTSGVSPSQAKGLPVAVRPWVDAWLRTNNPMRERVFRNTRATLLAYADAGLLPPGTVIPVRRVGDEFIPMTDAEAALYRHIRSYIKRSYNRYMSGDRAQQALGFIMTIYRRRLTSSFQAIRLSLERRREVLEQKLTAAELLDADDETAEPLLPLDLGDLERTPVHELEHEIWELGQFIKKLHQLPADESKMVRLHELIEASFVRGHDTVLVFTQYADTVDYVVDQLSTTYGSRVMAYAGSGGRRRDPETNAWVEVSKKETKRLFREGKGIKILVGTDALSEGLNLQTCGRLINYDMPWNFMRVEQRIGRLDRIDGKPVVEVTNLFYKDTIEEQIYRGIAEGQDGFSWVVGSAQPVLASIEDTIIEEELGPEDRSGPAQRLPLARPIEEIVAKLLDEIHAVEAQAVTVGIFNRPEADPAGGTISPLVTLQDVERVLLGSPATRSQLREHPSLAGTWLVDDEAGRPVAVTFDRQVLAEGAPEVRLLSYGDPLFELVLHRAGVRPEGARGASAGLLATRGASDSAPDAAGVEDAVGKTVAVPRQARSIAEQIGEFRLGDKL
ncbi:MAG: helicase-related protein [Acidimicrobiales bacterium]